MEKNCCNSQYFQGKNYETKFLVSLILKNKINKIFFGKIIKKQKKTMQGNTVTIYNAKFSTNSI